MEEEVGVLLHKEAVEEECRADVEECSREHVEECRELVEGCKEIVVVEVDKTHGKVEEDSEAREVEAVVEAGTEPSINILLNLLPCQHQIKSTKPWQGRLLSVHSRQSLYNFLMRGIN